MHSVNFDGMTEDDLLQWLADNIRIGHPDQLYYAHVKYWAMAARRAGNIQAALKLEGRLERAYARLPESLRW